MAPQDVIKQHGAEILRLWVAAQDYQEDLRISSQILKQLVEAYRKIRNTCRYLLSNVYDFDPHNPAHQVEISQLPELDRWALLRFNNLIRRVRKGYEEFDFRQIVHELDYFCSVDMSATYLDILKDRLYTFRADSPLRRGSQMVLFQIVTGLARLMAPTLSFTAEEVWDAVPGRKTSPEDSIHLSTFPEPVALPDEADLEHKWEKLLAIRIGVLLVLELHRRDKVIGSSLEARVVLKALPSIHPFLKDYGTEELATLCIVSKVDLIPIENLPSEGDAIESMGWNIEQGFNSHELGIAINVVKAEGEKCERCWNYRASVGSAPEHPTLCDRCIEAVT